MIWCKWDFWWQGSASTQLRGSYFYPCDFTRWSNFAPLFWTSHSRRGWVFLDRWIYLLVCKTWICWSVKAEASSKLFLLDQDGIFNKPQLDYDPVTQSVLNFHFFNSPMETGMHQISSFDVESLNVGARSRQDECVNGVLWLSTILLLSRFRLPHNVLFMVQSPPITAGPCHCIASPQHELKCFIQARISLMWSLLWPRGYA